MALNLGSPDDVVSLAQREGIDLTVVGPEAPLESGLADRFRSRGLPIVGPGAKGAALECSKTYAKAFMKRLDIPTADFVACTDPRAALEAVAGPRFGFPVVVKADGLAAGKGVTVAATREEAESAIRTAMVDKAFGSAGSRLVIEQCLSGPEVSMFYLLDGARAAYLGSAQDHKRIWDDDAGPNTGGMGAFAPSPLAGPQLERDVRRSVVQPVLDGCRASGHPYIGFLYVSLMLTGAGPRVIEFNVRFGDPEAQVVLPLIDGSLSELLHAAAHGTLTDSAVGMRHEMSVGVVLASRGYPAGSENGRTIEGLEAAASLDEVTVFHAGTKVVNGRLVTSGGRVLTVVGRGSSFDTAMARAYAGVEKIQFEGMQFRRDIGRKALRLGEE